jgi:hypothetical protein
VNLTPAQVKGVQLWVTETVTSVIDNVEPLYTAVQRAVRIAVDDVEPHPASPVIYRNRRATAAGEAVQDVLRGHLTRVPQPMRSLTEELLDFSDAAQWAAIGDHYADDEQP